MRILHVIRSVNPSHGGPVEVIKQVSPVLQEMGHEVLVVSLDRGEGTKGTKGTKGTDPWVRNFPLPLLALGGSTSTFGYSPKLIPWLEENASQFDGIFSHGLWQYNGLAVRKALRKAGKAYYVFPHGMLDPWFRVAYPLKHLKKLLYWKWVERFVLRDAKAAIFTCEEERDLARDTFSPYRCREEIITLGTSKPSSTSSALMEVFFQRFPEFRGKRILLFLGRLHDKKGCDLLLRAFSAVPTGMHLVFVGPHEEESYYKKLRELAGELPVSFLGLLEGDLKWGALAAAEAFILPSHQENFGMAVAESLAMGTPVLISSRVNIWREILADQAGLVEPDTLEGTRRLLERWMSTDRVMMREAAAECFRTRFDIRRTAENIVSLLQRNGQ